MLKRAGIDIVKVIQGDAMKAGKMLRKNIADKASLDPLHFSIGVLAKT